jgi:RNA polymerase sigma factor (sigma-70 family)
MTRSTTPAAAPSTEVLYREQRRTVSRICRTLLRDQVEAEDATQQVFLSAHRALLNGAHPRDPAAWLATIARNECFALNRARRSTPVPTAQESIERANLASQSEPPPPLELAVLWDEIAQLPPAQRDAFLLREIRGLSYDQLAERLEVSDASVRSLLSRARGRLRLRLRGAQRLLGGVSWLETLARLLAGGGSAVPAATKAVALGLGAAAITSGAAATPELLAHAHSTVRALALHPHGVSPALHTVAQVTSSNISFVTHDRSAGATGTHNGPAPHPLRASARPKKRGAGLSGEGGLRAGRPTTTAPQPAVASGSGATSGDDAAQPSTASGRSRDDADPATDDRSLRRTASDRGADGGPALDGSTSGDTNPSDHADGSGPGDPGSGDSGSGGTSGGDGGAGDSGAGDSGAGGTSDGGGSGGSSGDDGGHGGSGN